MNREMCSLKLSSSQANWLPDWVQSSPLKSNLSGKDKEECLSMNAPRVYNSSFDLVSPDGHVTQFERVDRRTMKCELSIENISPQFLGWSTSLDSITFNLKSTLAQLGVDGIMMHDKLKLCRDSLTALCDVMLTAETALGVLTLDYIELGSRVGKLFVVVQHRLVRTVQYFERLFGRKDRDGNPLLVYGREEGDWKLEVVDGRAIAWVQLQPGVISYDFEVTGFLPSLGLALKQRNDMNVKGILRLHQKHNTDASRFAYDRQVLMVRSKGMHIRTLFARVVPELLPKGIRCTSASIVEPHTKNDVEVECGRTFIFYGSDANQVELDRIPLEFFTLEPYREYVELHSRMKLWRLLTSYESASAAFLTAPQDPNIQACVFICKGSQLRELTQEVWITTCPTRAHALDPTSTPDVRLKIAQTNLHEQCQYSLLKAISEGYITSQGVLLTKYFISHILKHFLLSDVVSKTVRAIAFEQFSQEYGIFLSQTDRAMLQDLNTFGVEVFHVDKTTAKIYEYVHRVGYDCGLFVPQGTGPDYVNATYFGVYGSNLVEGDFENELMILFRGMKDDLQVNVNHAKLTGKKLAVVTGGGPGVMEMGNRVAKNVGLLSCGLFVDFGAAAREKGGVINEQKKNPYVDGFMTYRLEKLVERQSDFHLDFPIFCIGGIGTDFEFALEHVRRKVGSTPPTPIIMFGSLSYFEEKLTHAWLENKRQGVVRGSEWLSNIFYVVQSGKQALEVYRRFFLGTLRIGPSFPGNDRGYVVVDEAFMKEAC